MKAIFTAHLNTIGTTDMNGNNCEWAWTESSEEEYGREWDGDVAGYVANLDLEDGCEVVDEYAGAIHNLPEGAIVIACNDEPCEIYWAEEVETDEERFIKRFELRRNSAEFTPHEDIFPGCVAKYVHDSDPVTIASFDTAEEAIQELAKYESTVKKDPGQSVRFIWVEEYWVEETYYDQDEDGELVWVDYGDILDYSRMDFPQDEKENDKEYGYPLQ